MFSEQSYRFISETVFSIEFSGLHYCLFIKVLFACLICDSFYSLSKLFHFVKHFLFYFLSFVLCRSIRVHLSATKAIISLCPLSVNRKLYLFSHIFIFPQKPHKSCSDKSCILCFYLELYELCIIFILNFSLHVNIYFRCVYFDVPYRKYIMSFLQSIYFHKKPQEQGYQQMLLLFLRLS